MKERYPQLQDGECTTIKYFHRDGYKVACLRFCCCDCGLIHTIVMIPLLTRLKMFFYRDNRATATRRRGKALRGLKIPKQEKGK